MIYPYRIELNTNIINPNIFTDNPKAKDLNNIGTLEECKRIINIYFPAAIIEEKLNDSNSRRIINGDKLISYIVGNVYYDYVEKIEKKYPINKDLSTDKAKSLASELSFICRADYSLAEIEKDLDMELEDLGKTFEVQIKFNVDKRKEINNILDIVKDEIEKGEIEFNNQGLITNDGYILNKWANICKRENIIGQYRISEV
jgi:hypothetical protein